MEEEEAKRRKFYDEITEQQKAEFIAGEIIVHSPVKEKHAVASENLYRLLSTYVLVKKMGVVRHEKVLIRLTRNDFEPDICFFGKEKVKKFTPDQVFYPAPDFVVEVLSKGTEKRDRGLKFTDYALHGVNEYWLVDPEKKEVEQYSLHQGRFELVQKVQTGIIYSLTVEEFIIPVEAIFDDKENMKTLSKIIGG